MTNNEYLKIAGKRIAELRKEKGWTQKNLADKLHVSTSVIGHCERGRNISIDILCQIAERLETTTDYLLGLTNCKTSKMDYRAFCDTTGIDDTAVEILEEINFVYQGQYLIPLINFLIKQAKLPPDETLFEEKYRQIEESKMTDKEKQKHIRKVDSIYNRMNRRWQENNYVNILNSIDDYFITKAEDKNLCLTLSGELKREEDVTNEIEKSNIRKKITAQELLEEKQLEEIIESLKKAKQKYKKEMK